MLTTSSRWEWRPGGRGGRWLAGGTAVRPLQLSDALFRADWLLPPTAPCSLEKVSYNPVGISGWPLWRQTGQGERADGEGESTPRAEPWRSLGTCGSSFHRDDCSSHSLPFSRGKSPLPAAVTRGAWQLCPQDPCGTYDQVTRTGANWWQVFP